LKQESNKIVARSFKKNMQNRLSSLYVAFNDIQQLMEIDREELRFYGERIEMFERLKENRIDPVRVDPDREIIGAKHKKTDLKFNLLRSKVKLVAILYEIAYISNIGNLSKLIKEP